jgi:hypothetical protein
MLWKEQFYNHTVYITSGTLEYILTNGSHSCRSGSLFSRLFVSTIVRLEIYDMVSELYVQYERELPDPRMALRTTKIRCSVVSLHLRFLREP